MHVKCNKQKGRTQFAHTQHAQYKRIEIEEDNLTASGIRHVVNVLKLTNIHTSKAKSGHNHCGSKLKKVKITA